MLQIAKEKGQKILSWLKKNWYFLIAATILIAISYGTGRYFQPASVVEKEKIVEKIQYQDKIQYRDRVEIQKVYVEEKKKDKHRETVTVKAPDGTVTTKVVEDEKIDTREQVNETKVEIKYVDRVVEKTVDRIVEKEKVIDYKKPNWRIGPMVGYDVYSMVTNNPSWIPELQNVVLGVQIERRIAGPISVGVWGLTTGVVGIYANGEF